MYDRSSTISGKLLILGILGIAMVMAGFSWWFRYNATHRAANFWGHSIAQAIRDAQQVEACLVQRASKPVETQPAFAVDGTEYETITQIDISHAPGITHLRTALLEDRSFRWIQTDPDEKLKWALLIKFQPEGNQAQAQLLFTDNCEHVALLNEGAEPKIISCEPISPGLLKVREEWLADR